MSDRSWVSFIFLAAQAAEHTDLMEMIGAEVVDGVFAITKDWEEDQSNGIDPATEFYVDRDVVYLGFDECPWGVNEDMEAYLRDRQIDYDTEWDGVIGAYQGGERWVRFAKEGRMKVNEAFVDEHIDLDRLEATLKSDWSEKLRIHAALQQIRVWKMDKAEPCPMGAKPELFYGEEEEK